MSTRSTTHFIDSSYIDPATKKPYLGAICYRHSDGYPKGAGEDLCKFITQCKALADSRLTDPSMLAARYVVFLGEQFAAEGMFRSPDGKLHKHIPMGITDKDGWKHVRVPHKSRLDFLSVRIVMSDPWDIEYRYVVDCGKKDPKDPKRPLVKCFKVCIDDNGNDKYCTEVPIPGRTKVAPVTEQFINEHIVHSHTEAGVSYEVKKKSDAAATIGWIDLLMLR